MGHVLDGLSGRDRKKKWRERSNKAEWNVPEGRLGRVVIQLRDRGQQSYSRAQLILYALLVVIFIGLGYYVIRPLLQDWSDGKRAVYRDHISEVEAENNRLDRVRADLRNRLAGDLKPSGIQADSGTQRNIFDLFQFPGTKTVIAATAKSARGRDGSIIRSTDGGHKWRSVMTIPLSMPFRFAHIGGTQIVVAVGQRGIITRSEDNGESWEVVDAGVRDDLLSVLHVPKTQILIATGQRGWTLRSEDYGKSWDRVYGGEKGNSSAALIAPVPAAAAVVIADFDGNIRRSTDDGRNWVTVHTGDQQEPLRLFALRHIPNTKTLFAVGDRGLILRSDDYAETWTTVPSGTQKVLSNLLHIQQTNVLLVSGHSGTILKSKDLGKTWRSIETGTGKELITLKYVPSLRSILAAGAGGTILISHDYGETWRSVASASRADFWLMSFDPSTNAVITTGSDGAIVHLTDALSSKTKAFELASGQKGDRLLLDHFESLAPEIKNHALLTPYNLQFDDLIQARWRAKEKLETAEEALKAIKSGAYAIEQKQEAFSEFMKSCRGDAGGDTDGKVTEVCASAFKDVLPNETKFWWTTVAEEVPRGILLLFLLATLGTLYRYNLRLAAFHHSRADALELLSQEVTLDPEKLAILTDAMSAEKVEFGKANTPADQAADVAKAVINKVK